jgi:VanZ family protein
MPRSLLAFAPALAWALIVWMIGGLDSVPSGGLSRVPGADKLAHFGMYGVLGWLTGRGFRVAGLRRGGIGAVLLIMVMGAADELRQAGLSGRSAEIEDWLADAAGAATGFYLALRRGRARERHENDGSDE